MNITIKEIAISSLLILTGGCIIGCVATPATKKKKATVKRKTPTEVEEETPQNISIKKEISAPKQIIPKNSDQNKIQEVIKTEVAPTIKEEAKKESTPENKQEQVEDQEKQIELETPVLEFTDDDFPLRLGSKGQRVVALQKYLLRNHGSAGIVTDQYDQKMHQRVRKYLKVEKVDKALFNRLIYPKKRRR